MNWFKNIVGLFKKSELDKQISFAIDEFNNREIYKVLTKDLINQTSDDELIQLVHDFLDEKLPSEIDKEYSCIMNEFNSFQQALYLIWWLEGEVNNGGFNQYYTNSSRQFAELVPNLLNKVGAIKFSDLTCRAHKLYIKECSNIFAKQDGSVEGFCESYENNLLNDCDDEFYKLYKIENLAQLQIDFIRNNKDRVIV